MKWQFDRDPKTKAIWRLSQVSDCKRFRIAKYSTQAGDVYALWAVGKVPALHYGTRKECEDKADEAELLQRD